MVDIPDISKIRDAVVAYPEGALTIFIFGLSLGWGASWLLGHRELRVNRAVIDGLKEPNLPQVTKDQLLRTALPQRRIGPWVRSFGVILLAACIAAGVTWIIPKMSGPDGRHLKTDQKLRMHATLHLSPTEKFDFQINSSPSCDECERFAEELRDFFNETSGWTAGGGPLIFAGDRYRRGVWLVSRPDEKDLAPIEKIRKAFDDAGIPLQPDTDNLQKGTFVIVVARVER